MDIFTVATERGKGKMMEDGREFSLSYYRGMKDAKRKDSRKKKQQEEA